MKLGIDVSTYLEELASGAKYYDHGIQIDPLDCFYKNGVKSMRIRLWNNPYSSDGKPYLGGTCDLANFIKLAHLAISKGYSIYLDFHYSDFWADPGKQTKPKAWNDLDFNSLVNKVYQYTFDTLQVIKNENIDLEMIQVGNEITNGILWPDGRLIEASGERLNYESLAKLLKAGLTACKEVYPNALRMLHLERSYDLKIYDEFFSNMLKNDVDFEVIGASYYPYWHGTMDELIANLTYQRNKYHKMIMIAELGYAFTLEDYILNNNGQIGLVVNKNNLKSFSFVKKYPFTKDGQAKFINDFLDKCLKNGIDAIYYWEPLWIPGNNICWASEEALEYIGEVGKPTRNEWSNQCMFDYNGNMNPSFKTYKIWRFQITGGR